MDEIERYVFDTQGYLIIRQALDSDQVRRLLDAIPRGADGRALHVETPDDQLILGYDEPLYRELIAYPAIVDRLAWMMGTSRHRDPLAPPHDVLLSHQYLMTLRQGQKGPWFHNGGTPFDPLLAYDVRDGSIFSALTGVLWALTDAGPGDGGFWCIPGSHRGAFALPVEIGEYRRIPECVVQPTLRAGDALIFTEALTHGTRDWTAAHERVALFYKYVSRHLRWPPQQQPQAVLDRLTPEQRAWIDLGPVRPAASLPARIR